MLCESPSEIDSRRVDSPLSNPSSPMNGTRRASSTQSLKHADQPHGPRMARKEASTASSSSSGFTAVNGGDTIVVAIPSKLNRPSEPPAARATDSAEQDTPTTSSPDQPKPAHGWRVADAPANKTNGHATEPTKRKRGETATDESTSPNAIRERLDTSGPQSQKRRLVVSTDSPGDHSSVHASPEESTRSAVERRAAHHSTERRTGIYSREPSPIPLNQAGPRPVARPETVADLAASLHRELHGDSVSPTQTSPPGPGDRSTSPTGDERFSPEAQTPPSPDNADNGQANEDSKKRKRMFSNRTKTGCHTCRQRKKKCDERKPFCQNCERGGFQCTGYGAKPPNIKPVGTAQRAIALQSKPLHDPAYAHGAPLYHYPPHDGRPYMGWPHGPPPEHDPHRSMDPRHMRYYEPPAWGHRPPWQGGDPHAPPLHPHHSQLPPSGAPPPPALPPSGPLSHHPSERDRPRHLPDIPPPPPPLFHSHSSELLHPSLAHGPPPSVAPPGVYDADPWTGSNTLPPPIRSSNLPGMSSRDSVATSGSSSRLYATRYPSGSTDRKDMILGKAFLYYSNQNLLMDRQACRGALERYNEAARPSSYVSAEERGRFFRAVVDPSVRPGTTELQAAEMPCGDVGRETVVESPFSCDFGYNIHLGQEVIIQPGCYMQDPCEIRIGNRTMIGPNVRFYGLSTSNDPANRKGIRSRFYGGSIIVEEDCLIGADVIIMPFRRIGRGSIVGAGSVVTRDVPPDTVVAGNPARPIRDLRESRFTDRHKDDRIQQQNDRMLRDMQTSWENARERAR